MKTSILGLRTVIYKVSDLNASTAWYAKFFQTDPYFDEPFYVGFSIGGYELGLQPENVSVTEKSESVLTYWVFQLSILNTKGCWHLALLSTRSQ